MILDTRLVVAAVDFTDEDWRVTVAHAAHHARSREVGVHLVHVVAKTSWLMRRVMDEASIQAHETEQVAGARRRLSEACAVLKEQGVPASHEVRSGKPADMVLEVVKASNAGLLVIGIGNPSATAMIIGGTADRLLRTSTVPVLIRGPKAPAAIRHILVPTGLGPSGAVALERATHIVKDTDGGKVTALHMVALPGVMRAYSGDVNKLRSDLQAAALAELEAHVASIDAELIEPVLSSNLETVAADQTILAEARGREVDLICLALGGRTFTSGPVIGRVSHRVIRALPCPLLALPGSWIDARTPKASA